MSVRSVGVEEELLLVEPGTWRPVAVAGSVLAAARAEAGPGPEDPAAGGAADLELELQEQQLETNSRPCQTLSELRDELRRCRAAAADAAGKAGARVAALATSPVAVRPELAGRARYREMAGAFGLTADEQLTCGLHVHVGIDSDEEGVAVLDRIGRWLPVLLALSANSPFWQGRDSAYASFRYQAWGRWPSSGSAQPFGSAAGYHRAVDQMLATGTLLDDGMIYFDARLSAHYPTVEIRIADVCLRAEDALLIAALARGLVETEARAARDGRPPAGWRPELARLACWRASRSGLGGDLISPVSGQPEAAGAVARRLAAHCRDALDEAGDAGAVAELLAALLSRGSGADVQRAAYRRSGQLAGVVRDAVAVTAGGPEPG
jgi:carboxylate-amine ligase